MQTLSVADDGTTVIEFTDVEAHALRNVLPQLPGSAAAHELQRHLAMAHGEIGHQHGEVAAEPEKHRCPAFLRFPCGHCDHDLCQDCSRCCSCTCASGGVTPVSATAEPA